MPTSQAPAAGSINTSRLHVTLLVGQFGQCDAEASQTVRLNNSFAAARIVSTPLPPRTITGRAIPASRSIVVKMKGPSAAKRSISGYWVQRGRSSAEVPNKTKGVCVNRLQEPSSGFSLTLLCDWRSLNNWSKAAPADAEATKTPETSKN